LVGGNSRVKRKIEKRWKRKTEVFLVFKSKCKRFLGRQMRKFKGSTQSVRGQKGMKDKSQKRTNSVAKGLLRMGCRGKRQWGKNAYGQLGGRKSNKDEECTAKQERAEKEPRRDKKRRQQSPVPSWMPSRTEYANNRKEGKKVWFVCHRLFQNLSKGKH